MKSIQNEDIKVEWTLKLCRIKSGLKQQEMADKLGVSLDTYKNYESYRTIMRVDYALDFSRIVGIPFDSIIFFNN